MSIEILVICRHPEILQTIIRLLNQHDGWHAEGTAADEQALQLFKSKAFHMVLLGSGINDTSERMLRKAFVQQRPEIVIVQHFGGGSGLLSNEVMAALDLHGLNKKV